MISNKCYYGLCAMLELAKRDGSGPVTICDIADCQGIPARFLETILRQLKQGGFTESQRGKDGGYFLVRPAREIFAGEIIRLFEGPLLAFSPAKSSAQIRTVFSELLAGAQKAVSSVYDRVSLLDLAQRDKQLHETYVENYTI